MSVTTTIPPTSSLPTPPNRASDTPVDFYTKADAYNDDIYNNFQPSVNTTVAAINTVGTEINATAVDVNADADRAESAADSLGTYRGDWVAGYNTTGYSVSDAVTYGSAGGLYTSKLNTNLIEPTESTETVDWKYDLPKVPEAPNDGINYSRRNKAWQQSPMTEQEAAVGQLVLNIIKVTQAEYDALTPVGTSMYLIVG